MNPKKELRIDLEENKKLINRTLFVFAVLAIASIANILLKIFAWGC